MTDAENGQRFQYLKTRMDFIFHEVLATSTERLDTLVGDSVVGGQGGHTPIEISSSLPSSFVFNETLPLRNN